MPHDAIWDLLTSPEPTVLHQGLELLRSLHEPELIAALADGLSVSPTGGIQGNALTDAQPNSSVRGSLVLALLVLSGRLRAHDTVNLIGPFQLARLEDLRWLEGQPGPLTINLEIRKDHEAHALPATLPVEALHLSCKARPDLRTVAALPLKRLTLWAIPNTRGWAALDLAPLAHHPTLQVLHIHRMPIADVSPVPSIPRLTSLAAAGAADLSPLRPLRRLLRGVGVDLCGLPERDGILLDPDEVHALLHVDAPSGQPHPLADTEHIHLPRHRLRSLAPLRAMKRLRTLQARSDGPRAEQHVLVGLPALEEVHLRFGPADRLVLKGRLEVRLWQQTYGAPIPPAPEADALAALLCTDPAEGLRQARCASRATLLSLTEGMAVTSDGTLHLPAADQRPAFLDPVPTRAWLALALLRLRGALSDCKKLRLGPDQPLESAAPLAGLWGLQTLVLLGGGAAREVATLPNLTHLDLRSCEGVPAELRTRLASTFAIRRALRAATLRR